MQVFCDLLIDLRIILSFSCRISDGAWQMANQDFFYLILKDSSFSSCFLFNKRQASLSRLASSSSLVPGNAGLLTRMDARGGGPPTGTVQCAQWVACPRYTKEGGGGLQRQGAAAGRAPGRQAACTTGRVTAEYQPRPGRPRALLAAETAGAANKVWSASRLWQTALIQQIIQISPDCTYF